MAEEVHMDTEQIQSNKRKNVDLDYNDLPDTKRNKAMPEAASKLQACKLIIHWHEYIFHAFKFTDRSAIDSIALITSTLETLHTRFRQGMNKVGGLITKITATHQFKMNETTLTYEQLSVPILKIAALYGLTYVASESQKKFIGTVNALLSLHAGYKHRFAEVRIGNSKITLKKDAALGTLETPLSTFGLSNSHAVLLSGCTYTPVVASGMKQTLGPMAIAINLAQTTVSTYQAPWLEVFNQVFKLFPYCNDIAELLKGSRSTHQTLLRTIADIALFGTTRSSHKAFFPMAMLLTMCYTNTTYKTLFEKACSTEAAIPDTAIPHPIGNLDRSGRGAYNFWNLCGDYNFTMKRGKDMSDRICREMLFHATWGTHIEDLGVLKFMTNHIFHTRREMGETLAKRADAAEMKPFHIIKFVRVSKMANASQTHFLEGGSGQVARQPVFSGKISTRVDLNGDLMKFLRPIGEKYRVVTGNSLDKIMSALDDVKRNIEQMVTKNRSIMYGTTGWCKAPDGSENAKYGEDVTEECIASNQFFY